MAGEAQPRRVRCPVCNTETGDRTCSECGEDLSLLHECQDLAVACYNLGLHLAQRHRRDSNEHARQCLSMAIALRANFVEPYIVLGKLHAQQNRFSQAIACWSKAISLDSKNKEAQDCLNALRKLLGGNEDLRLEANWRGRPVRIGSSVQCADGSKGVVWRIIPGNKSKEFTHIVVWVLARWFDTLFPRDFLVPIGLITDVSGNAVFVGMQLQELLHMPRCRADEVLADRVTSLLLTCEPIRAIQGKALTVAVADGALTLSGNVLSCSIKKQAEQLALSVKGVLAVNNLLVSDTDLELSVACTLASSPYDRAGKIFVRSNLGVVSLEGGVDSAEAKAAITEMVLRTKGVKAVINRLTCGES